MREQESNLQKKWSVRVQRQATVKLWQIILIGACSLAINMDKIFCVDQRIGHQQQSNVVSYNNAPRQQQYPAQQATIANQPADAKTHRLVDPDSLNGSGQQVQPKIYHSIIDATTTHQSTALPAAPSSTLMSGDLHAAAGHHYGHASGKYYEYRAVPKKKTWKFGYKRGNHKHTISRHEHGKAGKHPHFKTKVKWHDLKSKGKGIHLWDYNHHDKKHYHHG